MNNDNSSPQTSVEGHSSSHGHSHSHSESHSHSHSHSQSHSESDSDSHSHSHSHSNRVPHSHSGTHTNGHSHSESHSHTNGHSRLDPAPHITNGYAFPSPFVGAPTPVSTYLAPAAFSERHTPSLVTNGHSHSSKSAVSPTHFTTPLALAATLLLASLSAAPSVAPFSSSATTSSSHLLETPLLAPKPFSALLSTLTSAAALGAGTLLLYGGYGKLRHPGGSVDEGGGKFYPKKRGESVSALDVVEKAVAVTVPYFAALEIGAVRTAAVVLGFAAAGMVGVGRNGVREMVVGRKGVLAAVGAGVGWDLWMGLGRESGVLSCLIAYPLLVLSLLFLSPPYPLHLTSSSSGARTPLSTKPNQSSFPKLARNPSTLMTSAAFAGTNSAYQNKLSLISGALLSSYPIINWVLTTGSPAVDSAGENAIYWWVLSVITGFSAVEFGKGVRELGFGAGVVMAVLAAWGLGMDDMTGLLGNIGFGGLVWAGMQFDKSSHSHEHHDHHVHVHDAHGHTPGPKEAKAPSAITRSLMKSTVGIPLLHSILIERDSRRIFYFMCLNFVFMLVQTSYGFTTGSLGLISDSVHMFFDCLALFVGLCAAVMSKWPPSQRYPYGLSKMDTLAGFANGIFLMLISIEIVWEAIERLQTPTEMSRLVELVIVSALGLGVNLVGIMAFDHAHMHHGHSHSHSHAPEPAAVHAHDHDDHDHDHDHGHDHDHDHDHDHHHHSHSEDPAPPPKPVPHAHSHDSENMHGIFLHILADTLGSASVVISTLAIQYTGWTGFDPLASVFIAVLIFFSAIPLVKSAASNLLLTVPANTEYTLRETLAGVSGVKGVAGYTVPRFWEVDGRVRGVVHVQAIRGADVEVVRGAVEKWLEGGLGGCEVVVVVERWGEGCWCWCGGGPSGGGTIGVQR